MRHLTPPFAAGALRRGRVVEQLLEAFEEDGRRGLRWCCVWPANRFRGYVVRLHVVEECEELPVDEFPPFYETDGDEATTIGETDSAEAAIELAAQRLGAGAARWVNPGVLFDEYADYVEQGRPLGAWRPT